MAPFAGYQSGNTENKHNIIFVVKNVSIDYRRPALLDDELTVTAEVAQLKGASMLFEHTVLKEGDELNKCSVTIVCVDGKTIRADCHTG